MFQTGDLRPILQQSIIFLLRRFELDVLIFSNVRDTDPATKVGEYLIIRGVYLAGKLFDFGLLVIHCVLSLKDGSARFMEIGRTQVTFFRSFFCLLMVSLA